MTERSLLIAYLKELRSIRLAISRWSVHNDALGRWLTGIPDGGGALLGGKSQLLPNGRKHRYLLPHLSRCHGLLTTAATKPRRPSPVAGISGARRSKDPP